MYFPANTKVLLSSRCLPPLGLGSVVHVAAVKPDPIRFATMPINYSKWDNLTLSDDSDDEQQAFPSAPRAPAGTATRSNVSPTTTKPPASSTIHKATPTATSSITETSTPEPTTPAGNVSKAVLPRELWLRIFHFNSEPIHLWMKGRRVNHTWRKWIPKVFAEKYLTKPAMVTIRYQLATVRVPGTGKLAE